MASLIINRMEGTYVIQRHEHIDLSINTSIVLRAKSSLDIFVGIQPHGRMEGEYEIFKRPRIIKTLYPIQDTYVYENVPTLNYGNRNALHVGKDEQGNRFRTFLEYDLNELQTGLYIVSAKLILNVLDPLYTLHMMEISTLNRKFYEYDVTWNVQPTRDLFLNIINLTPYQNQIEIDVTDIIKLWYQNKRTNYGFVLKEFENYSGEIISFFSKEYNIELSPRLEIEYLDPDFKIPNWSNLNIDSTIAIPKHNDLTISTYFSYTEAESDLKIDTFITNLIGELYTETTISRTSLDIDTSIITPCENDLLIDAIVATPLINDKEINTIITQNSISVITDIVTFSDLFIETIVSQESCIIDSTISQKDIKIDTNVVVFDSLSVNTQITGINDLLLDIDIKFRSDLNTDVIISQDALPITTEILMANDLITITNIRTKQENDLDIDTIIQRDFVTLKTFIQKCSDILIDTSIIQKESLPINSLVVWGRTNDINTYTDIKGNVNLDINTMIYSNVMDIETSVAKRYSSLLSLDTDIVVFKEMDISTDIKTHRNLSIYTQIMKLYFNDLDIEVIIGGDISRRRAYVFIM